MIFLNKKVDLNKYRQDFIKKMVMFKLQIYHYKLLLDFVEKYNKEKIII